MNSPIGKHKVVKHRSVSSIFSVFFEDKHWRTNPKAGMDGGTKESFVRAKEMEKFVRRDGFWGFVTDDKVPVIHFWTDGNCTEERLLHFMAHELGHITGKPLSGYKEELRADTYAEVASRALAFARKHARKD